MFQLHRDPFGPGHDPDDPDVPEREAAGGESPDQPVRLGGGRVAAVRILRGDRRGDRLRRIALRIDPRRQDRGTVSTGAAV